LQKKFVVKGSPVTLSNRESRRSVIIFISFESFYPRPPPDSRVSQCFNTNLVLLRPFELSVDRVLFLHS
jgi:hypothetical protein